MQQPLQQQQQVIYTTAIPSNATIITVQAQPAPVRPVVPVDYVLGFKRSASHAMGGVMLLMAFTSWAGATMAIIFNAYNYYYGDGYWCGLFFLIAGSLALDAGSRPTRSRITACLVFAFISLALAGTQFGLSLVGLIYNIDNPTIFSCYWFGVSYFSCPYTNTEREIANGLLVGAAGMQILLSLVEMFICLHGVCSNKHVEPVGNIQPAASAVLITSSDPHQQLQQQQQQQFYQQYPTTSTNQYQQPPPDYNDTVLDTSVANPVHTSKIPVNADDDDY